MDLPEASKEVVQVFASRGRLFSQRPQLSWDVSVIDLWHGKGLLVVFVLVQRGSRVRHTQEHKTRQAPLHCESLLQFSKQVRTAAPAVGGLCGLSCAQEVFLGGTSSLH